MVAKIIAYESQDEKQNWWRSTVFVADNESEDWESVFISMNEDTSALLPAAMNTPAERYLDDYLDSSLDDVDLADDVQMDIDAGAALVNYGGHASLQAWGSEQFLTNAAVDNWTNGSKYPFIVSMSCLTGFFAYSEAYYDLWGVEVQSLAEKLLRTEGKGSAAVLMPTGQTTTDGQHIFNTALYEAIFTQDTRELGAAISSAKQSLLANGDKYYEQVSKTFLLFGDPAMELKLPMPRRPRGLAAALREDGAVAISWQAATDSVGNPVAGYNLYRRVLGDDRFVQLNTELITTTEFVDTTVDTAQRAVQAGGTTYYYAVTSVDAVDGDQSIVAQVNSVRVDTSDQEQPEDPSPSGGSDIFPEIIDGGLGNDPCFITTAAEPIDLNAKWPTLALLALSLLLFGLKSTKACKLGGQDAGKHEGLQAGKQKSWEAWMLESLKAWCLL